MQYHSSCCISIFLCKLLNQLLILQPAHQQPAILLGHDVTIQSFQHHLLFVLRMYDAVPAVEHTYIITYRRVSLFVRSQQRVQRTPASQVTPAEVHRKHINLLCLLHHRIVNRNLFASRDEPFQLVRLSLCVQARSQFIHHPRNLRRIHSQSSRNRFHVPHKDSRIPQVVSCIQILLCCFHIGLFAERIHPEYSTALQLLASTYVAVSRFRSGRAYPQSYDTFRIFRKVQSLPNVTSELLRINHQCVRGRHHDVCLRILLPDFIPFISNFNLCYYQSIYLSNIIQKKRPDNNHP